ncbi:MAG: dienelactone hydrolase family protein [Ktedonobacteraceae bacterium]|nr:dienelactone hydrolase family protein [Ktedonobacteraceae bacterium]
MAKLDTEQVVRIPIGEIQVEGALAIPEQAQGVVIFAHGSGSSRFSPRNAFVARELRRDGIGILLIDLLTEAEEAIEAARFDVDLLTERLLRSTNWLRNQPCAQNLVIGYFGASTGAAAALKAAAALGSGIGAVVSRGGRPDLAEEVLAQVQSPTLFIVGGRDDIVLRLNRQAYAQLKGTKQFEVVPGATHLFEEPGALEEVARLATRWFQIHLR